MLKRFFIASSLSILLSAGFVLAQNNRAASIVVEVKDAQGRQLKNACVTFVPREGEILFQKADRNGRVKMKNLAAGSYRVVVKVAGYVSQKKEVTLASDGEENVTFAMPAQD